LGVFIGDCSITQPVSAKDSDEYMMSLGWVNSSNTDGINVREVKDVETGVHYLYFYDSYSQSAGACPRYNADGSLYVD